jgi:dynein heavy chain
LVDFRFEDDVYNEWTQGVDEVAKANLEKPLVLRDLKSSLISVNFDPNLVALLREVKYLEQREGTDHKIPESAAAIFSQNEMYRKFLQVCRQ